jgi:hypothetical protein
VLCQQGLQFFPERLAAAREIRRVLRDGGIAGASIWAAGRRLEPFDDYSEALVAADVDPPFLGAFENASFVMGADEARRLFEDAGFTAIDISIVEHTITWPDAQSAAAGILGTPFGPLVEALPPDRREGAGRRSHQAVRHPLSRRADPADNSLGRRASHARRDLTTFKPGQLPSSRQRIAQNAPRSVRARAARLTASTADGTVKITQLQSRVEALLDRSQWGHG